MRSLEALDNLKRAINAKCLQYAGHDETLIRLWRAVDILIKDSSYTLTQMSKTHWIVESSKMGLTGNIDVDVYSVHLDNKSCSCPDGERGNICKHRQAVELLVAMENGE